MASKTLSLNLELKSLRDREFEGYGSIFKNVDLGGDVVLPGAFARSLADHRKAGTMPPMFWMHQPDQVPGVWTAMKEDTRGLHVKGELVDTTLGNEMRTLLQKKAVRGLSIGYRTVDSEYSDSGDRLLKDVDLWEVSIVSLAMNPLAEVEAVKARLSHDGEFVPTKREFERLLRDAGCSKKTAGTIIARIYHDDDDDTGGTPAAGSLRDAVDDIELAAAKAVAMNVAAKIAAAHRKS